MFGMLNRVPNQVEWREITPGHTFEIASSDGAQTSLTCKAVSLGTKFPAYVSSEKASVLAAGEALLGLIIESRSGKKLAYMPAVPRIDDDLQRFLEATDVLLFDGTFWNDDELMRVQGSGQTAQQMGHVAIGGAEGTLQKLAGLRRPRKIFLHINNTNPMLDESGVEFRATCAAGWEIAEDGWQFEL